MYNYMPRNEDELELKEGDVVDVMEKCDDGWFVGKRSLVVVLIVIYIFTYYSYTCCMRVSWCLYCMFFVVFQLVVLYLILKKILNYK